MTAQELLYIVLLALISSLVGWGVHSVTRPGMLLEFIDTAWYWFTGKLSRVPLLMRFFHQLALPLFRCPICCSSVWSTVVWLTLVGPFHWHLLILILMVCGLNTLVVIFTHYDYEQNGEPNTTD